MIEVRDFRGKINKDDNAYKIQKGDYADALNITRDAQGGGQDMVVSTVVGNQSALYFRATTTLTPNTPTNDIFSINFFGIPFPNTNIIINFFDGTTTQVLTSYITQQYDTIPIILTNLLSNVVSYTGQIVLISGANQLEVSYDNTLYSAFNYSISSTILGSNKVIGNYADKLRNRQYFFIWNSNGYDKICYYDGTTNEVVLVMEDKTYTDNVRILNFDPSWRINHIDIVYRDDDGDLLFWTDGLNPPSKINVKTAIDGGYGTIQRSYIDVAKEPPASPPYCVYEDNNTVTVNNLNNKQFKFKYRYVFDDLEKSVTSAQSEVPIPKNYSNQNTASDPTKNSSIFILLDSGPPNVTKIEILGSESLGVNWSDFFLIKVLDKAELGIYNNNTAQFKFFNDQAYSTIPIDESIQPFDNVPQIAYTQSLPNGNVLDYGAITENYDLLVPDYETTILNNSLLSSRIAQTALIKVYLVTNPILAIKIIIAGTPSVNDEYTFGWLINGSPFTVGGLISTTNTTAGLVSQIGSYLLTFGFLVQIDPDNNLIVTRPPDVFSLNLPSSSLSVATLLSRDSQLVYDWFSRYSYGVVYFDEKGRTNSVITSIPSTFGTQPYAELSSSAAQPVYIPQQQFSINSRPPDWASYFEIVRTKNLTKSNFLYWTSIATYLDARTDSFGNRYAYVSISNLTDVISENASLKGLGYEFSVGDRIRFVKKYAADGSTTSVYSDKDFQIIESLTNPLITSTYGTLIIVGQVLKIAYPATSGSFQFGGPNNKNYLLELYTPAPNFSNDLNLYYEFGEKYAVGNPGTSLAYHYGMIQNQDANLTQPALYNFYKGDSYFRNRNIPLGGKATWNLQAHNYSGTYTIFCMTSDLSFDNTDRAATYVPQSATNPLSSIPMPLNTLIMNIINPVNLSFKVSGSITIKPSINLTLSAYFIIWEWDSSRTTSTPRYISSLGPLSAGVEKTILIGNLLQPLSTTRYLSFGLAGFAGDLIAADVTFTDTISVTQPIIDPNFSDAYPSNSSPNGRAWKFDPNAGRAFNPTLIRFGGEFQANTTVNNINRFYEENNDTYDRSRGSIKKMFIEGRNQFIFQEFDVGVVTVLTQIVRDTAGNPLSAQSEKLLNKIVYPYIGQYGIGNVPESFAYGKRAKYFVDNNKGVVCRLSSDGITPLSIIYKMNAFFVAKLAGFKENLNTTIPALGTPTVYGAFDAYTNKYVLALSEINRDDFYQEPYTLAFLETRDASEGFESFLSFHPENIGALNNLFISFNAGSTWTHNSNTYCNFYSIQYDSYIDGVFNDNAIDKKSFLAIMQTSNSVWYCPSIISQVNTYGSTPQETEINEARFVLQEGQYNSAILRDKNSPGGLINGQTMKGNYIVVRFQKDNASNFYYINTVSLKYNNSPLNTR